MKILSFCTILLSLFLVSEISGKSARSILLNQAAIIVDVDPFVVNGVPARIEDFPWHLGLIDLRLGGNICGASNISPRFALSAAHCLDLGTPANQINLWGGSTSRFTGGHIFFVDQYINHPQFDQHSWDNDVSILYVDAHTPLEGFPNVSPSQMPPVCNTECCTVCMGGSEITVAGWGIDNMSTLGRPENIHMVDKPISNLAECSSIWQQERGGVSSRMFCTAIIDGRDSCNGDSGSAIIRDGVQVGLVSYGSDYCGDGSAPAVYVRLEHPEIRNFINQHTGI